MIGFQRNPYQFIGPPPRPNKPPSWWMRLIGNRIALACSVLLLSVCTGWIVSPEFGLGIRSAAPASIDSDGGYLGEIETLRMPIGARTKDDISTFKIENGGGDDYVRIYVNNYLVLSDESPERLFYMTAPGAQNEEVRKKFLEMAVDRREYRLGAVDIAPFLRSGYNYIVFENENSTLGACSTGVMMSVNEQKLEGFPKQIPARFTAEASVLNASLVKRAKEAGLPHLNNALCARRVFSIYLY
ncbi:hypothetical protein [Rhizobium leguminosarum]|uniref:Transmembrane protein n=1 Tax=Rhizobium leguminosarum TaxID=384 RepID=A0A2K9ZFZ2_RHILE|nr:hypothetical protein [Rhizobium leguminosarum]AUW47172.1 hypothetical protein CUJ84_pRLN3000031 [Rhizobium leguminosarum]